MRIFVEPSPELPLVSFSVTFIGGRLHEPVGKDGLARVTARMLRRGAGPFDAEQLEQHADALGAELGSGVGLGSTTISCEVLSRSLDHAVDLVATMLAEPRHDAEELGRLLRQTEAELVRSRDNDSLLCSRALRRHLFAGHPHRLRVQGDAAGLRAITRSDVVAFQENTFRRGSALVAFTGDIDEIRAEALATRLLAGVPDGETAPYPPDPPPVPGGRRLVIVDKPGRSQAQLAIGTLGTLPADEDHTALTVANTAFGGTFTSRMVQEIRAKRGWSYGASSHLTTSRIRETFSMWASPESAVVTDCLALELEMLDRWIREGITADELTFCQGYLRRSWAFEIDTAKKRLSQRIERALLELPDDYHTGFVDRVAAVTLDEANAAVKRRISSENLWVAVVGEAASLKAPLGEALGVASSDVVVERYDVE